MTPKTMAHTQTVPVHLRAIEMSTTCPTLDFATISSMTLDLSLGVQCMTL